MLHTLRMLPASWLVVGCVYRGACACVCVCGLVLLLSMLLLSALN